MRSPKELLLVSLLLLTCFFTVTLFRSSFATINLGINVWAASINSSFFTPVAVGISVAFDSVALSVASLAIAAVLLVKKRWKYGLLLLGSMAGDALIVSAFKTIIASPRPPNEILAETGYSFPSGHVTGSVVFFGILAYIIWKQWGSLKVKASTVGLYVTIVAVVGFDRIYLNVHWFSDEAGAVLLGAFLVTFSISVFNYLVSRKKRLRLAFFGKT